VTAATPIPLMRRLQLSGLLIALGLVVEAVTLFWSHPTAFLVFLGLGGLLVGLARISHRRYGKGLSPVV
jgi:hypothetical protein